jgi:hypothetical protein
MTVARTKSLSYEKLLEQVRKDPDVTFTLDAHGGGAKLDWKATAKANFRTAGRMLLANDGFTETRVAWQDTPELFFVPGLQLAIIGAEVLGGVVYGIKELAEGTRALVKASRSPFEVVERASEKPSRAEAEIRDLADARAFEKHVRQWSLAVRALDGHPKVMARRDALAESGDRVLLSKPFGDPNRPRQIALTDRGLGIVTFYTPQSFEFTPFKKVDERSLSYLSTRHTPEALLEKILSEA